VEAGQPFLEFLQAVRIEVDAVAGAFDQIRRLGKLDRGGVRKLRRLAVGGIVFGQAQQVGVQLRQGTIDRYAFLATQPRQHAGAAVEQLGSMGLPVVRQQQFFDVGGLHGLPGERLQLPVQPLQPFLDRGRIAVGLDPADHVLPGCGEPTYLVEGAA